MRVRVYVQGRAENELLLAAYPCDIAPALIRDVIRLEKGRVVGYGFEGCHNFGVHLRVPEKPQRFRAGDRAWAGKIVTAEAINDLLERLEAVEKNSLHPHDVVHVRDFAALDQRSRNRYETAKDRIENLERGWARMGFDVTAIQRRQEEVERQLVAAAKLMALLVRSLKRSAFKKKGS